MDEKRLSELAHKFLTGQSTPEEEAQLHAWWDEETNTEEEQVVVSAAPETPESVKSRMLMALDREIDRETKVGGVGGKVKKMGYRWLAVASAVIVVAALSILIPFRRNAKSDDAGDQSILEARSIKPGGNRAVLELSDGRNIVLDSAQQGLITSESGTRIAKQGNDELTYTTTKQGKPAFNTVVTPKGGQYQVVLPDGSHVWLNAASSIRFPTVFEGPERRVELSGEAYFEVVTDASRPFKVTVSPRAGMPVCELTVLGTNFNVNSYADENTLRTVLLKGSVRIAAVRTKHAGLLKPGQEAVLDKNDDLQIRDNSDTGDVIAWKEGLFKFKNAPIDEVMKQMARWYDVDVVYSGKVPEHFVSTLPMHADLYQGLQTLQKTGRVHFKADGRTITVFPR